MGAAKRVLPSAWPVSARGDTDALRLRLAKLMGVAVAIGLAVLLVGWAAVRLFGAQEVIAESAPFTLVTVEPGDVGQSIGLSVAATWGSRVVASNASVGVVTSVNVRQGDTVTSGDSLYSVNLRPTVVALGRVPAFRPLSLEDRGRDVSQLQHLLTSLGLFSGEPDGVFGAGTEGAVTRWQRSLGIARTGSVEPGDIVFVPELPLRVLLDTTVIAVGGSVVGGEPAIKTLAAAPTFQMSVTDSQDVLIGDRTRIIIDGHDRTRWTARVAARRAGDEGGSLLTLSAPDGGAACRAACDVLPVGRQTLLSSQVIVVPPTEGLVLPSAAVASRADGTLVVELSNGDQQVVSIRAEALGRVIVEGVDQDTKVRIPASVN